MIRGEPLWHRLRYSVIGPSIDVLHKHAKLAAGNHYSCGFQFQNFRNARKVPVAACASPHCRYRFRNAGRRCVSARGVCPCRVANVRLPRLRSIAPSSWCMGAGYVMTGFRKHADGFTIMTRKPQRGGRHTGAVERVEGNLQWRRSNLKYVNSFYDLTAGCGVSAAFPDATVSRFPACPARQNSWTPIRRR